MTDTGKHRLGELVPVGDGERSRVFDGVERQLTALTVEPGGVNIENVQRIQRGAGLGELAFRPLVHSGRRAQRGALPVLACDWCCGQREATGFAVL